VSYVGDAYRYTLTPVFAGLATSFRCHIRRQPPDVIYRVSFYITLPGPSGFESPMLEEQLLTGTSTQNSIKWANRMNFNRGIT